MPTENMLSRSRLRERMSDKEKVLRRSAYIPTFMRCKNEESIARNNTETGNPIDGQADCPNFKRNPLHHAALSGDPKGVREILTTILFQDGERTKQTTHPYLDTPDVDGNTPLHLACLGLASTAMNTENVQRAQSRAKLLAAHQETIALLLAAGSNRALLNRRRQNCLHLVSWALDDSLVVLDVVRRIVTVDDTNVRDYLRVSKRQSNTGVDIVASVQALPLPSDITNASSNPRLACKNPNYGHKAIPYALLAQHDMDQSCGTKHPLTKAMLWTADIDGQTPLHCALLSSATLVSKNDKDTACKKMSVLQYLASCSDSTLLLDSLSAPLDDEKYRDLIQNSLPTTFTFKVSNEEKAVDSMRRAATQYCSQPGTHPFVGINVRGASVLQLAVGLAAPAIVFETLLWVALSHVKETLRARESPEVPQARLSATNETHLKVLKRAALSPLFRMAVYAALNTRSEIIRTILHLDVLNFVDACPGCGKVAELQQKHEWLRNGFKQRFLGESPEIQIIRSLLKFGADPNEDYSFVEDTDENLDLSGTSLSRKSMLDMAALRLVAATYPYLQNDELCSLETTLTSALRAKHFNQDPEQAVSFWRQMKTSYSDLVALQHVAVAELIISEGGADVDGGAHANVQLMGNACTLDTSPLFKLAEIGATHLLPFQEERSRQLEQLLYDYGGIEGSESVTCLDSANFRAKLSGYSRLGLRSGASQGRLRRVMVEKILRRINPNSGKSEFVRRKIVEEAERWKSTMGDAALSGFGLFQVDFSIPDHLAGEHAPNGLCLKLHLSRSTLPGLALTYQRHVDEANAKNLIGAEEWVGDQASENAIQFESVFQVETPPPFLTTLSKYLCGACIPAHASSDAHEPLANELRTFKSFVLNTGFSTQYNPPRTPFPAGPSTLEANQSKQYVTRFFTVFQAAYACNISSSRISTPTTSPKLNKSGVPHLKSYTHVSTDVAKNYLRCLRARLIGQGKEQPCGTYLDIDWQRLHNFYTGPAPNKKKNGERHHLAHYFHSLRIAEEFGPSMPERGYFLSNEYVRDCGMSIIFNYYRKKTRSSPLYPTTSEENLSPQASCSCESNSNSGDSWPFLPPCEQFMDMLLSHGADVNLGRNVSVGHIETSLEAAITQGNSNAVAVLTAFGSEHIPSPKIRAAQTQTILVPLQNCWCRFCCSSDVAKAIDQSINSIQSPSLGCELFLRPSEQCESTLPKRLHEGQNDEDFEDDFI